MDYVCYIYMYNEVGSRSCILTYEVTQAQIALRFATGYEYDDFERLDKLSHFRTEGTAEGPGCVTGNDFELIASYDYTVRRDGRRTDVSEARYPTDGSGVVSADIHYTYDVLNRLTSEYYDGTGADAPADYHIAYDYDRVGNRVGLVERVSDVSGSTLRRDITYGYTHSGDDLGGLLDRLYEETDRDASGTILRTQTYMYDDNGFMYEKSDGTKITTYGADIETRLSSISDNGYGTLYEFAYDHMGLRVSLERGSESTSLLVDSNNHTGFGQVVQQRTDGAPAREYILGDDVLGYRVNDADQNVGLVQSYLYDGHGSVRAQVAIDQPETMAGSSALDYDAYGNVRLGSSMPSADMRLAYAGEWVEWLDDTATPEIYESMQYLRARWYDSATGRFNRTDPFAGDNGEPQSLHKYAYVHGDPVTGVDPSGLFFTLIGQLAVAFIQGIVRLTMRAVRAFKGLMKAYKLLVALAVLGNISLALASDDKKLILWTAVAIPYNYKLLAMFLKRPKSTKPSVLWGIKNIVKYGLQGFANKAGRAGFGISTAGIRVTYKANGQPDYSPFLYPHLFNTQFIRLTGSRYKDKKKVNRVLKWTRGTRGNRTPTGYTWHHHEVVGVMQLVAKSAHAGTRHAGGAFFWRILKNKAKYK